MALLNYSPPTKPYLEIIYQDDSLVVFNKPSGLLSVRGKATEHQDSLQARAESVWPQVGVVHRLDMSTSGLMVMALNKDALRALNRQFQQRETEKCYQAIVWSKPKESSGTIELPLIVDWPNRPKQKVCFDQGKPSETRWQLLESDGEKSRVALIPITGRSHQLRVHMASIGHPILGDKFYAHQQAFELAPRLNLHAKSLSLTHPVSKKRLDFESPVPF